jgi:N,N-dimethylformamidase
MIPIVAYADRLSVAPGEDIAFKVSSTGAEPYEARLVRVICGDPNPAGPGIKEEEVDADLGGPYPSRVQAVHGGSYGRVEDAPDLGGLESFTLMATIWPTTPEKGEQGILAKLDPASGAGFALVVGAGGGIAALLGDGKGGVVRAEVTAPMRERAWYRVWAAYDAERGKLSANQAPLEPVFNIVDSGTAEARPGFTPVLDSSAPLLVAALGGDPATNHYNGKIEYPALFDRALPDPAAAPFESALAAWDFSQDIPGTRMMDAGPHGLHGEFVNLPARAMTGSNWTGAEMCWRHAPAEYGAVHFHDDDLYDCGWETDFTFTVPGDMRSGVYAVRLAHGEAEDMVPFFVRPPRGGATSSACVLVPTYTYVIYANYARENTDDRYRARAAAMGARPWTPDDHPAFGISTYNTHSDGSGVCYSSRLRPIITFRSGFMAYDDPYGSGLRHFPADTHLFDWLDAMGHDFDVVTDEDLQEEGAALIAPYKVVMTTTHPEYHTPETLDALAAYTHRGGRLMYLGGNGFYWRIALHRELEGVFEIRRGEGGVRTWAAEPGEYYNSFDGAYGGLWRRSGRPPQRLAGLGFSSQGDFIGSYYRRAPGADDPRASWIFEGVEDEVLGDFGLSGGGAAGFEVDRMDLRLGTPAHALVVASSEAHSPDHILVPEEVLGHDTNWPGPPTEELIRADMIYYEMPDGGAVFSVGSIIFCGSLSHNGYDNNISRITNNVLTRFRGD